MGRLLAIDGVNLCIKNICSSNGNVSFSGDYHRNGLIVVKVALKIASGYSRDKNAFTGS